MKDIKYFPWINTDIIELVNGAKNDAQQGKFLPMVGKIDELAQKGYDDPVLKMLLETNCNAHFLKDAKYEAVSAIVDKRVKDFIRAKRDIKETYDRMGYGSNKTQSLFYILENNLPKFGSPFAFVDGKYHPINPCKQITFK